MKGGERRFNFSRKEMLESGGCSNLNFKQIRPAEVPFLSTFLLPPLKLYAAPGRLKKKLCCSFETQRWPFLTALALGSYPAGL